MKYDSRFDCSRKITGTKNYIQLIIRRYHYTCVINITCYHYVFIGIKKQQKCVYLGMIKLIKITFFQYSSEYFNAQI